MPGWREEQRTKRGPLIVALLYGAGVLAYVVFAFLTSERDVLRSVDERLERGARVLKYLLSPDFHDRATGPEAIGFEEELRNRARMNAFSREAGFAYAYTLVEREGRYYFAAPTVTDTEAQERRSWYFYPYEDVPREFEEAYRSGLPTGVTYQDQWGTFRSMAFPETSPGGKRYLACADTDVGFVRALVRGKAAAALLTGLFFTVLSLPGLVLLRRAERKAARKSQELELLADTVDQQIWRMEDPRIYGLVNQAHGSFLGLDKDDVVCRTLEMLWSEEDARALEAGNDEVFRTGVRLHMEHWLTDGAGRRRLLSVVRTPRIGPSGKVEYVVCSAEDVTEIRLIQKTLAESEERHRAILNTVQTGIVLVDARTRRIVDTNPVALKMLGVRGEDLQGRICHETICPAGSYHCPVLDQGDTVVGMETVLMRQDGSCLPVLKTISRLSLGDRDYLIESFVDLSDRKSMEEALRESEERLSLALEGADLALWDVDFRSGSIITNERYVQLHGSDTSFMSHLSLDSWESLIVPEDRPRVAATWQAHLRGETPTYECVHRRRNFGEEGKEVWVLDRGKVFVRDSRGQPVRAAGTLLDVSADRRNEELLRRAKESAEASNRAKSAFLANMSHEIRTPLNAILGYVQLLLRDANLLPSQRASLEIIGRSGDHLLALINDVLEMSKIEAGYVTLREDPFDFLSMLDELGDLFRPRAEEKGLGLSVSASQIPRLLVGDGGKVRQILINVLGNAVKFTDGGNIMLRCRRGDVAEDGKIAVEVEVEDSGIGLAAEDRERVFAPFEQAGDHLKKRSGTGLGMAISRHFARLMGGDLSISRSVPNKGSVFLFVFRAFPVPEGVTIQEERRRVTGLAPDSPRPRILVVDDQETSRRPLAEVLIRVGLDVMEARDGVEALELFQEHGAGVVILDLLMPRMGGYETLAHLRTLPGGDRVPVVVVTASFLDDEKDRIQRDDVSAVLSKPLHEKDLFWTLSRVAGIRFLYAEAVFLADNQSGIGLSRASLSVLPEEFREEMARAVAEGDQVRLLGLIDAMDLLVPAVAGPLRRMAEGYDYPSLSRLFGASEEEGNPGPGERS